MCSKLPIRAWGYVILHVGNLIKLRPFMLDLSTPNELLFRVILNIAHLQVFGCKVFVPIPPPQRTKMGPQRRLGIYVGFVSPSIIQYLEPSTGNLLRARFADCVFDELNFPSLEGVHDKEKHLNFSATDLNFSQPNPRTEDGEKEVQQILHLKSITKNLPNAFNDASNVFKSLIPAKNAPIRLHPDPPIDHLKKTSSRNVVHTQKRFRVNTRNISFMLTPPSPKRVSLWPPLGEIILWPLMLRTLCINMIISPFHKNIYQLHPH